MYVNARQPTQRGEKYDTCNQNPSQGFHRLPPEKEETHSVIFCCLPTLHPPCVSPESRPPLSHPATTTFHHLVGGIHRQNQYTTRTCALLILHDWLHLCQQKITTFFFQQTLLHQKLFHDLLENEKKAGPKLLFIIFVWELLLLVVPVKDACVSRFAKCFITHTTDRPFVFVPTIRAINCVAARKIV